MKVVAALQPGYLPWLGFFDLMKRSDLFIIEDSLKFTKQDWRNRNRIRTAQGTGYLTVPVKKGATDLRINDVMIDNSRPWGRRHLNLLEHNYRGAPYWADYEAFLRETFDRAWTRLIDLDLWFIDFFRREFAIKTETALLSELAVTFGPDKTRSLVELLQAVWGDVFLEGATGKGFIEPTQFEEAGLRVEFQDYVCRPYPQQFKPFVSHLSAIDLLLNTGPDGSDVI
jgi:hypothetical protein